MARTVSPSIFGLYSLVAMIDEFLEDCLSFHQAKKLTGSAQNSDSADGSPKGSQRSGILSCGEPDVDLWGINRYYYSCTI